MNIPQAIQDILHHKSVDNVVDLLVENDARLRKAVRAWSSSGGRENLLKAITAYERAGKDWVEDRYSDDLKKITTLASKYKWVISNTSDKATSRWYNTDNWRVATLYLATTDPKTTTATPPHPWPKTNGQHQVWTIHLYYPTVGYIRSSSLSGVKEMYSIPKHLAPRGFTSLHIPPEVENFAKDFKKLFPTKNSNGSPRG